MGTVHFEGKPKELVQYEREHDPNYVPIEKRINVEIGRFKYATGRHDFVYKYTSFEQYKENYSFDEYVDKCIQNALVHGKINFIYHTPGNVVFIGISTSA